MKEMKNEKNYIRIRGASEHNLKNLCQTVLRADGKTKCGEYRRTISSHFH